MASHPGTPPPNPFTEQSIRDLPTEHHVLRDPADIDKTAHPDYEGGLAEGHEERRGRFGRMAGRIASHIVERGLEEDLAAVDSFVRQGIHGAYRHPEGADQTWQPKPASHTYDIHERSAGTTAAILHVREVEEKGAQKLSHRIADRIAPHGSKRRDVLAREAEHLSHRLTDVTTGLQPDRFATGQTRRDQEIWTAHIASPDVLRPRRVKEVRDRAFYEATRSGLTDEQAARQILGGEFIEIDHEENQHDLANQAHRPTYLAPRTFSNYFGVSEEEWQRTVFRDAIIEGGIRIAGVDKEHVNREALIPHHVISQFKEMLARSDEQLDDLDRSWSAKRSWENAVDFREILDPKNVLFLRQKITAAGVKAGIRRGDMTDTFQSGQGLTADMHYMAKYFDVSVGDWHKQVVTHEIHTIPNEVLQKFSDLLRLPEKALVELARAHRGVPGPDGRIHAPDERSGVRGRINDLEHELEQAFTSTGSNGEKPIAEQLASAKKNVLNITGREAQHSLRLEHIGDQAKKRLDAKNRLAEHGWSMIGKYEHAEVKALLRLDADVEKELKSRVSKGQLDPTADDYGNKCTEVRTKMYRTRISKNLTIDQVQEIYGDIKRIKQDYAEVNGVIDQARQLIQSSQSGSEYLIRQKIRLTRKTKSGEVEAWMSEAQAEYVMNALQDMGIVGPEQFGPDGNKQRRDVLVDKNGNPKP